MSSSTKSTGGILRPTYLGLIATEEDAHLVLTACLSGVLLHAPWHDVDYDGTIKELSAKEKLSYDEEKNKLLVEHEKKRAAIEAEAVKIGL